MNWIELQDGYVVSGWWPMSTNLQHRFGLVVTLLDAGTIWSLQLCPMFSPHIRFTTDFEELMKANKDKPYLILENKEKKDVYLNDTTKAGVLQFVKNVIGSLDFAELFKPLCDVSTLQSMDFTQASTETLCSGDFIQNLRKEYTNGSVILKSFHTESSPLIQQMIHTFIPHPILAYFLTLNPTIQAGLDDLKISESPTAFIFSESLGSNRLFGDLLNVLRSGGVYSGSRSHDFAHDLQVTTTFIEHLLGNRKSEVIACAIYGAWTSYFFDIWSDNTFLIIDPGAGNIHFLYMTDTD